MKKRLHIKITGNVQGVGFRPLVYSLAKKFDLNGFVCNHLECVIVEAEGQEFDLELFKKSLPISAPKISTIDCIETKKIPLKHDDHFKIIASKNKGVPNTIPPDFATCANCIEEIFDPANRRHLYPFTNCSECGPRFTIIEKLPYDRNNTTMKKFIMCDSCKKEYSDPENRRFHAQPIACHECGPFVSLWNSRGASISTHYTAIRDVVSKVRQGCIIALKGLGGFQFLVDANNSDAIAKLRTKKNRPEKPLAVMFLNLESINKHCIVSQQESDLLHSSAAPIVLLQKNSDFNLPDNIAPDNAYLGAFLPYTPLHHILMKELKTPLIVTSANKEGEVICIDETEAIESLGNIADFFLVHNRPILRHADDSIARIICNHKMVLRNARGYAPLKINMSKNLSLSKKKIIAIGTQQKNAIAIYNDNTIVLSQYIGDLSVYKNYHTSIKTIADFQKLFQITPQTMVADLNQNYQNYALCRTFQGTQKYVQHHYAHVLSVMAEHNLKPPALGISWDGTGAGTDQTIWGGEFLCVENNHFTRYAHFLPFALPGGDKAICEPRRVAFSLLFQLFGIEVIHMDDLPCIASFSIQERKMLVTMLQKNLHSPKTSSIGRLFDALASLTNICHINEFEGQAALKLEYHAKKTTDDTYHYIFDKQKKVIDWRIMILQVVAEIRDSVDVDFIATKFHKTLVAIILDVCKDSLHKTIILSGGCFQNKVLLQNTILQLLEQKFEVYWPQSVPANDNGIAVGQIAAALQDI